MKKIVILLMLALSQSWPAGAEEGEVYFTVRLLSSKISQQIVAAAVADCDRRGYRVSAAVVDRNGNLAAFIRHPMAAPHTIKASQQKAFSSASVQAATSDLSHRPDLRFAPDMLLIVGGVPIRFNGHFYGAVAVGGAPPEIDEKCALAGVEAVSEIMDFVD